MTGRIAGAPVRCIRNEMTDHYIELENKGTNRDELEEITIGSLSKAVYEGDTVHGSMMSGQIAGLVKEIRPCKEILDTIIADAQKVLQNTEIKNLQTSAGFCCSFKLVSKQIALLLNFFDQFHDCIGSCCLSLENNIF